MIRSSHPKQQALLFLLGAVLVGGVLGFSANRVFGGRDAVPTWGGNPREWRQRTYDDLDLNAQQRATWDSLLDTRWAKIDSVMKIYWPTLDSIKKSTHAALKVTLDSTQNAKWEERNREW